MKKRALLWLLCLILCLLPATLACAKAYVPSFSDLTGIACGGYVINPDDAQNPHMYWYQDISSETYTAFLNVCEALGYTVSDGIPSNGYLFYFMENTAEGITFVTAWTPYGMAVANYCVQPDSCASLTASTLDEFWAGYTIAADASEASYNSSLNADSSYSGGYSGGSTTTVERCSMCNGSGICQVCFGKRNYYITSYGNGPGTYVDCQGCQGTGKCWVCNGTGR